MLIRTGANHLFAGWGKVAFALGNSGVPFMVQLAGEAQKSNYTIHPQLWKH